MPGSFMLERLLLCEADKPFQMPCPHPEEARKAVSKGEGSERGAFATDAGWC
jgi:hypothetical protein